MERSIRHATDIASPDIFDGQITLGKCSKNNSDCRKGELCIIIHSKVRASMKNVEYNKKSAITHNNFLATECNLKTLDFVTLLGADTLTLSMATVLLCMTQQTSQWHPRAVQLCSVHYIIHIMECAAQKRE